VVGEAASVLGGARSRVVAAAVAVALLLAYDATALRFPELSAWESVAWTGIVLGVPLFGLLLLALPLHARSRAWLALATLGLVALAVASTLTGFAGVANIAKLGAAGAAGFLFASFFEDATWLLAIALVIPVADTLSVWRGPTRYIVTKRPDAFAVDSVAFAGPGARVVELRWHPLPADGKGPYTVQTWRIVSGAKTHHRATKVQGTAYDVVTDGHLRYAIELDGPAGKTKLGVGPFSKHPSAPTGVQRLTRVTARNAADRLGLTDVVFFAVFLAGAARFRLRPGWTWVGLVLGITASGAAGIWDPFGIGGVPALPFISLGFLVPNADLLWRALRGGGRAQRD
jgi:hypothetical protein